MKYHFYISLLLLGNFISAQDTIQHLNGVVNFQLDPLGQLVFQDQNGRLLRRDLAADTTYFFYDNLLGEISYVDVSNPFGPLVYFEDFDLVLLLDRTLNEVGRIDYRSSEVISSSKAVARNFDNRIWLFDNGDFRLKLLNGEGTIIQQSDDLRRLLNIYTPPNQLFLNASTLYAYFPQRGIAVFSNFGQFLRWEAKNLSIEKLLFDSRRGIGWRIEDQYFLLLNNGEQRKIQLPLWVQDLQDGAQLLPTADGFWLLNGKSLLFLK